MTVRNFCRRPWSLVLFVGGFRTKHAALTFEAVWWKPHEHRRMKRRWSMLGLTNAQVLAAEPSQCVPWTCCCNTVHGCHESRSKCTALLVSLSAACARV